MLIKEPLPSMPCNSREMVEIAGNLIDNAVEAAELLEEEQRKVFFEIGKDKTGTFFMTIKMCIRDSCWSLKIRRSWRST